MAFTIWFRLLFPDGNRYSITRPTTLSSPESPLIIDRFCKLVKAEFPNKLASFDADDLFVYRNQTALDANENPLEGDLSLTALTQGKSMEDALVVVVQPLGGKTYEPVTSPLQEHRPQMQDRQDVGFNTELNVICCKLSSDFLKENGLQSYRNAALMCIKNSKVTELLNKLDTYIVPQGKPCDFTCIIAPSGTGKTQLAATAVAADKNVIYFYTGSADEGSAQAFYKPHQDLTKELLKLVRELRESCRIDLSSVRGADFLLDNYSQRDTPVFSFLYRCFSGSPSPNAVTLERLRALTLNENKKLLVFLDEVPPATAIDEFHNVIFLRNILRAAGVSPVLMSTHSGSINAIPSGSDSRRSENSSKWCRVLVNLPQYQADDNVFKDNPWIKQTERPLVAAMMVNLTEKLVLSKIVDAIQQKLQKQKRFAWLNTPVMQLCQLFRTDADYVDDSYKHRIVGYHFGRIYMEDDPSEITRENTDKWIEDRRIGFVNPETEPILFLALTTWKMAHIQSSSKRFFPLVRKFGGGTSWEPVSIREAFDEASCLFSKPIYTRNDSAKKLDGDDMEVLALASITLASLQSDGGVFQNIRLPQFLSSVFHFMCPQVLYTNKMEKTAEDIRVLLEGTQFSFLTIPSCPSTNSSFSQVWSGHNIPSFSSGQLKRLPDSERRDGVVSCESGEVLHVECKNLSGGINVQVAKCMIERIRHKSKLSIFFVSNLTNIFATPCSWATFANDLTIHEHTISFLVLEEHKSPAWLTVGGLELNCRKETEHLAVYIASGTVAPQRT